MIVICISLSDSGREISESSWLTIGKEYNVLEIYGKKDSIKYRLIGDDGHTPALHAAECFESVSGDILQDWVFQRFSGNNWVLRPKLFSRPGFWTEYFDGDPRAQAIFGEVLQYINRGNQ